MSVAPSPRLSNLIDSNSNIWKRYFKLLNAINCGKCGDRVQNISWRFENLPSSSRLQDVVIMCGTSNIQHTSVEDIVDGIVKIALLLRRKYHSIAIFASGLLHGDNN